MAQRDDRKRLGKKHRDPSTRPKKGRAPRVTPTTGAVDPRKRKVLATKRAALEKKKRTPTRSPENESRRTLPAGPGTPKKTAPKKPTGSTAAPRAGSHQDNAGSPQDNIVGRQTPNSANIGRPEPDATTADLRAWDRAEALAGQMSLQPATASLQPAALLPLIAICGRPNVGKSTLFNRLTGSRRSIVGDEPGITRDRIYGEIEWMGADARIVDTGGVVPDDEALIPSEIFRQAQVALSEANAIIMVVDGRTELASPDMELARLLLRGGKPVFLAVNKMDTESLQPQAENFRQLGFANVAAISAEHGSGIGDLLDEVFAALPAPIVKSIPPTAMLTELDELDEDATGPDFTEPPGAGLLFSSRSEAEGPASPANSRPGAPPVAPSSEHWDEQDPNRPRRLRSHGSFDARETRIAIIGRPNVGKSTLLNALTGTARAIVSPIAGTTRDAVDEVVTRGAHDFRFVDTAGIRRKGKTHLMAEKLSVIMARKHLEAADVSLLVLDATEGVTALDANIGGYAHESGRSVIIVVNKWDLVINPPASGHSPQDPSSRPEPQAQRRAPHISSYRTGPSPQDPSSRPEPQAERTDPRISSSSTNHSPQDPSSRPGPQAERRAPHISSYRTGPSPQDPSSRPEPQAERRAPRISSSAPGDSPQDPSSRPEPQAERRDPRISSSSTGQGWDAKRSGSSTAPVDQKIYEQQVRDHLKYLDYAPIVFLSAASGKGIEALFKKVELVARERRKRVTTGQMNRFLAKVDFQKASVPMNRRVRIYYMTQAAVAPPTFVLFTDKDVKLHFAFERFLANQIRANFGFIGSPIWFKTRPRNKKSPEA
jgi:GTP-binding protein